MRRNSSHMECGQLQFLFKLSSNIVHCIRGHSFFPYKGFLMRSPNKFQLKYFLELCTMQLRTCFPCVRSLVSGKVGLQRTPPSSTENAKVERNSSPDKSSSPLSEAEVSQELVFLALEVSRLERQVRREHIPPRVRTLRLNEIVYQINPPRP